MKVILIARTIAYGGGAERLVFETYNALKDKIGSSNVKLIVFQHSSIFNIKGLGTYEKALENDKNFHCLNVIVKLSILKKNKIDVSELERIINDFKPDIIHSHLYLAELISRQVKYPYAKWFSHLHDNMEQFESIKLNTLFNKKKITNFFEKRHLFNKYKDNTFIAISNDTYEFAKKRIKKHKLVFLPNAINLNQFYRFQPIQFDKIRIINIGSFVEKKNHKLIIDIAKELKNRKIDFEIILLGDGHLMKEIKDITNKYNLNGQIIFKGIVKDVNKYLNDSNIYLHTAKYEPFGLSLLEGMAVGLPIICLDGKGNTDLIKKDYNGFIIKNEDVNKFCDKIIYLYNNFNKYNEISKNAITYSKNYGIENYISNLLKIYES